MGSPVDAQFERSLARLGGDKEIFNELVRYFLEDVGPLLDLTEQAVRLGDRRLSEWGAHSIKGLATNFDDEALFGLAAAAEDAARRGHLDLLAQRLPPMRQAAESLARKLRRLFNQRG